MNPEPVLIRPDWALPSQVVAAVSTRAGGYSQAPWNSLNLGLHVGDDPAKVALNRASVRNWLQGLAGETALQLQWIEQVHGTCVFRADRDTCAMVPQADAVYTQSAGVVCGVLTADCLPVMYCSGKGEEVAVAHAGWRGLVNGVLEATLQEFSRPDQVSAWLGPAIGPCHFQVGPEVKAEFLAKSHPEDLGRTAAAFTPGNADRWFGDLYALARIRLRRAGVSQITGESDCTCCQPERWFSYRQQAQTGRFASLIFINSSCAI